MEIVSEEIIFDGDGRKLKRTFRSGLIDYILLEASDAYKTNVLEPLQLAEQVQREAERVQTEVSTKMRDTAMKQLENEADPVYQEQTKILDAITSVISLTGMEQAAAKLEVLGEKSFIWLDDYIETNVTNLAEAKDFLKRLSSCVLAMLKIQRILANRNMG
jgi:hypothetical protein